MSQKAILYDGPKCTACRGCQAACKQWNGLPGEITANMGSYENPPDLSSNTWLKIKFKEVNRREATVAWIFGRQSCNHCTDAACVSVCPTRSVFHHELGFVGHDKAQCIGCGRCVKACPFEVPRRSGTELTGWGKMGKCTFCQDRVSNGLEPACVKTCPTGALSFGDRDSLLVEAQKRVSVLKAMRDPLDFSYSLYPYASLYGDTQRDGLHVIYILTEDGTNHELPANPEVSTSAGSWTDILKPVGFTLAGLAAFGIGMNFLVNRARRIREKEGK